MTDSPTASPAIRGAAGAVAAGARLGHLGAGRRAEAAVEVLVYEGRGDGGAAARAVAERTLGHAHCQYARDCRRARPRDNTTNIRTPASDIALFSSAPQPPRIRARHA